MSNRRYSDGESAEGSHGEREASDSRRAQGGRPATGAESIRDRRRVLPGDHGRQRGGLSRDRGDGRPDAGGEVSAHARLSARGAENKYNAWYYKSEVHGASSGKLRGKRIALKDNVCLAGVPMMNGASTLEGYVPDVDATIVTRMLDAGGTILGKVHCEYFCFSGGSHTSAAGPVQNPRRPGYSAGGSSSGSAAVVAAGEVDMAIGGDQGGSIRIPAAYCGVYGLKPTHGLVPYTGIFPIELTLDHTGPMTATVADNALLLEVLAGPDGLDPRQVNVKTAAYTNALTGDARGIKIAVVKEGFGHASSESDVDALVRRGAATFRQLGAQVDEVSIPLHLAGPVIWTPIAVEGATWQMLNGNGFGFNWKGLYVTSLIDAHSAWRQRADEFSDTLKTTILFGQYAPGGM